MVRCDTEQIALVPKLMNARIRFSDPPVMEVVCGAMFGALRKLLTPHLGVFWEDIRSEFPRIEERPLLATMIESTTQSGEPHSNPFEISDVPPWPRIWLHGADGKSLLQIQRDRFHYNWKRPDGSVDYPSYDTIFPEFNKHFSTFRAFIEKEELGSLEIRQFELTYVNHIDSKTAQVVGEQAADVLVDHTRDVSRPRFLPSPRSFNWNTWYLLPNDAGTLYVIAQSAIRQTDGEPLLRLDLTARGIGDDVSDKGMRAWFDLAHEWIVQGFVDSTAQLMQDQVWGRLK